MNISENMKKPKKNANTLQMHTQLPPGQNHQTSQTARLT